MLTLASILSVNTVIMASFVFIISGVPDNELDDFFGLNKVLSLLGLKRAATLCCGLKTVLDL